MTALTRLRFELLALRASSVGLDDSGTKPSDESEDRKSSRNDVMSRMVEMEMKFCVKTSVSHMMDKVSHIKTCLFAESPDCTGGLALRAQACALVVSLCVRQQITIACGKLRACPVCDMN